MTWYEKHHAASENKKKHYVNGRKGEQELAKKGPGPSKRPPPQKQSKQARKKISITISR